jgi:hypothetical protein
MMDNLTKNGIVRDRIMMGKDLWKLYRTDRIHFARTLEEIDGPSWPKHAYTNMGQCFRIDDDGFIWCTSG